VGLMEIEHLWQFS